MITDAAVRHQCFKGCPLRHLARALGWPLSWAFSPRTRPQPMSAFRPRQPQSGDPVIALAPGFDVGIPPGA